MTPTRMLFTLASTALVLASAPAHADVVPDGQRYVEAHNDLTGSATLTGRTLMLVTVNDRVRGLVRITPKVGDGPFEVPSGYRVSSYLVALTPAEVAELDGLRKGAWSYEPASEREEPGALRKFFDKKGLASSDILPWKFLVPRGGPEQGAMIHWTITGVGGDALQMTATVDLVDASGAVIGAGGDGLLPIALAGVGVVALAGLVFFLLRRRAQRLPRPSPSA